MKRLIGILLLGSALAACGGDDGSGIDSDKAITELSGDELVSLCEYLRDAIDPELTVEAGCVRQGIAAGEQGADCQMVTDDCLEASTPDPLDCSEAETEPLPDCPELTVGEFQDCYSALGDSLADTANLTCENSVSDLPGIPEACSAAMTDCPELFGAAREASGAQSQPFTRLRSLSALR